MSPQAEGDLIATQDAPAEGQNDADSVFSEDPSSTTSIASSVLEYRQIRGRTYHSDRFTNNYHIPNDDQQLESEELCHHVLTILFDDQLFLAPLETDKMHRVLDVGTGSGIWAIEFGDRFPNASVIGTDISPCQPQWVPPNVSFEIDDATLEWTWNANHFDFVHIRYILGGIQDWTALFKEAYRCCAPGGWLQSVEYDVEFRSDDGTTELEPVLASYADLFREAGKVMNRPFFVQELQQQALDEAGFVEQKMIRYKIPIGPWAKDPKFAEVGRVARAAMENDVEGYTQMIWHSVLQRSATEYTVWLANLQKAVRNPKVHSYMMVHVVYGRKP
ncbi:uncharacterized protein CPUR_02116 [Claviceps purpurea 20.1]|uniref:S-adenosyl-L-methionine-dependent methyltransferase n=1 Tax=Claviceps purpurea (strain 20.1) TaxID=1111077 RepID=M1WIV0_CLAP2|nr:uncharacterized protein CPUR_02116 [Claviceps purpurea 20.1]